MPCHIHQRRLRNFARTRLPLIPMDMDFGAAAHAANDLVFIEPAEGIEMAGLADIEKSQTDMFFALAETEKAASNPFCSMLV